MLLCGLAACSGGSGGSSDAGSGSGNTPQPPTPTPAPAPVAEFVEVTTGSGIQFEVGYSKIRGDLFEVPYLAGGVAAGDYDNDGDIDLFVVRGDIGPNQLYRNEGNNVFAEVAETAGVANTRSATENYRHSGPIFADIDGDEDLDLFVGGVQGDPSRVFANNGDGTFSDVTTGSGLDQMGASQTVSAAFGDYDLDGDIDLFLSHWGVERSEADPGDTEHLWRNDSTAGQIRFVSVSEAAEISPSIISLPDPYVPLQDIDYSFAPAFVHLNDDIYPDILMSGDVNGSMVFLNDGDGTFTNVTDVEVIKDANGMGSAIGDYDNDGDMDWFVSSIYRDSNPMVENGNRLYRNDGGEFVDVTDEAGVIDGGWGWAACFFDFENDTDLDLYHTNGWQFDHIGDFTADTSRAFVSNGDGTFTDEAFNLGLADKDQGRGAVCGDFDNDGDVDIFLWANEGRNGGSLFRNDSSGNNFLAVTLRGKAPNTVAAGARIIATVGNTTMLREVTIASNYISQVPTEQYFGTGKAAQVDSLQVRWPDGTSTDFGIVQANQRIILEQP